MSTNSFYLQQAEALFAEGEVGSAILVLERAVEQGPDHTGVTKLLARLNLRINEVRAFQNWCHESLRIDEHDPEPHEMLAAYFEANGRPAEAAEERRVAAALRQAASAGTRA
jgi:Flp pilus assembly protein TadD